MRVRIALGILSLLLILAGCKSSPPKVTQLDESSAKELIQEEPFEVQLNDLHPLFNRTLKDYTAPGDEKEACIQRLIEKSYVIRSVEPRSYPRISGKFSIETRDFNLEMVPNTNRLTGTYVQRDSTLFAGTYKAYGSVEPDGKTQVTIEGFSTENAQYREEGAVAYLDFPGRSWKGNATGQRVSANWYTYRWSPEIEKQLRHKQNEVLITAGKFEVTGVSNLRLVTETRATAKITWRASLNTFGKAFFSDQPPTGEGDIAFAKRPDGTWFFDTTED